MMIKRIVLLLLLAGSFTLANGKTPGYLGKTNIIYLTHNFGPNLFNENALNMYFINAKMELQYEKVVSSNFSLGIAAKKYYTSMPYPVPVEVELIYIPLDRVSTTFDAYPSEQGYISAHHIGVYGKKYRSNIYSAPIGFYARYGLDLIFAKVRISEDGLLATDGFNTYPGPNYVAKFDLNNPYVSTMAEFTLGANYVIRDHWVTDIGVQFGWVFKAWQHHELFANNSSYDQSNYMFYKSRGRIFGHNLVNFRWGFGYLF